ncbi:MAG: hypothetical protein LQ337_005697 [Flavoplaca oasis]|nr:MAG: hypothetical protein LQ337_005697 [Flavoplaca oasis]
MSPLPTDIAEYRALIRLADLLTQRVVTWLARVLRYQSPHKSTGNAYHNIVLEKAPNVVRKEISVPQGLPETLRLAILFRRQAMEFDKKKVRQNPKPPAKKTKQAKKSSQKPAKKHHKATKKLKKHEDEIQIAEKSLKHLLSALNLAATTVAGPADDQDDEDDHDHEENTIHPSDADDDEDLDPYPLYFPLEDFKEMLEQDLLTEEEIVAYNDWVSRRNLANNGLFSDSNSESESESSDE